MTNYNMCVSVMCCRVTVSIRDVLSWVRFINATAKPLDCASSMELEDSHLLDVPLAYVHGACLVFLDGLGSGMY